MHVGVGNRRFEGIDRGLLGALLARGGEVERGLVELARAEALLREDGAPADLERCLADQADALRRAGAAP